MELEKIIAKKLMGLKAFRVQTLSPFTWANGWKSPIYLDDRKILSYPSVRNFFKLELSHRVAEYFPDADVIAGIATNAIVHGVLVAEELALPFVYVHPTPKDHGLENQVEGDLRPHQNVVIIENQVNVGSNVQKVIEAIRSNGCNVLGVVTIFDYHLPSAVKRLNSAGVELLSLTNFGALIEQAEEMKLCSEEEIRVLHEWHKAPSQWGK